MNRIKLYFLLTALSLSMGLTAQDDDFFLRSEEKAEDQILESSEFAQDDGEYLDDVIFRTLVEDNRVLDYAPLDEIDVIWEKRIWRVLDLREKLNQPFRNEDRPFFDILKDLAENGDIKVFKDENFKEVLSIDELRSSMNRIDTTTTYDPETYEDSIVITESPINPNDIQR